MYKVGGGGRQARGISCSSWTAIFAHGPVMQDDITLRALVGLMSTPSPDCITHQSAPPLPLFSSLEEKIHDTSMLGSGPSTGRSQPGGALQLSTVGWFVAKCTITAHKARPPQHDSLSVLIVKRTIPSVR